MGMLGGEQCRRKGSEGDSSSCWVQVFLCFSSFPAEILQANDKLTQALGRCRQVVASLEDDGGGGSVTGLSDAPGKEDAAVFHNSSASCFWCMNGAWKGNRFLENRCGENPLTWENYDVVIITLCFFFVCLFDFTFG